MPSHCAKAPDSLILNLNRSFLLCCFQGVLRILVFVRYPARCTAAWHTLHSDTKVVEVPTRVLLIAYGIKLNHVDMIKFSAVNNIKERLDARLPKTLL